MLSRLGNAGQEVHTPLRLEEICGGILGSAKGFFSKSGLLTSVHLLGAPEIVEILESPQVVETEGESDHFLEGPENLEIQFWRF